MPTLNLVNDYDGKSTVFSTFMDDGNIISQVDNRFIKFDSMGKPVDIVEFEGHSNKNKGENQWSGFDTIYYIVYWHDYLCSNDEGINR